MSRTRERSQPRISVTKLGEYMVASASRRRRIVVDQKRPADCVVARYTDAQNSIAEFILARGNDDLLRSELERIAGTEAQGDWQEQNRQLCVEALRAFGSVRADLMPALADVDLRRGDNDSPKLNISGVAVSVRPEIIVVGRTRQGDVAYGAVKLYLSKTNPLTPEAGEFAATTVHQFVGDCLCGDSADAPEAERRSCYVVDVFSNTIFTPPKAYVRRRHDVTAACEEVCRAWGAL